MQATIRIKGNQVEQYQLTLWLPTVWCKLFRSRNNIPVFGEGLCAAWGVLMDGDNWRMKVGSYVTLEEAQVAAGTIHRDIAAAKKFLRSVINTDLTHTIDLGGDDE